MKKLIGYSLILLPIFASAIFLAVLNMEVFLICFITMTLFASIITGVILIAD